MSKRALSIGIITHMGWVCAGIVRLESGGDLRIIHTVRVDTCYSADRESLEPYHVAGGFDGLTRVPAPDDPAAVIENGRQKQCAATLANFSQLKQAVKQHGELTHAGLLTGRGRLAPTLDKVLASHAQIHIAEGDAVRAAVASALEALGVELRRIDKKDLLTVAQEELGLDRLAILSELGGKAPANEGPWRQEEKFAALTGWLAASA
ncbi:MAG: hypothetical protein O6766_08435 [Gammaproteobacteria bacterium]|nr:hypothetical protein [Gammaproteobacteria bacterium]